MPNNNMADFPPFFLSVVCLYFTVKTASLCTTHCIEFLLFIVYWHLISRKCQFLFFCLQKRGKTAAKCDFCKMWQAHILVTTNCSLPFRHCALLQDFCKCCKDINKCYCSRQKVNQAMWQTHWLVGNCKQTSAVNQTTLNLCLSKMINLKSYNDHIIARQFSHEINLLFVQKKCF